MGAIPEFRRFTLNMNDKIVTEGVVFSTGHAAAIMLAHGAEVIDFNPEQLQIFLSEWDRYKGNEIVWLDDKAVLGDF